MVWNGLTTRTVSHLVKVDDVLTFAQRSGIRVVGITDVGSRRGAGRPTKAERRAMDRLRGRSPE